MLEIAVKTMDSQSRTFQVPESITVGDFKRRIAESVNIPPPSQRLIFQGRVLTDNFILTSAHHEKTLHLVERQQQTPSTTSLTSTGASTRSTTTSSTPSPANINMMPAMDFFNQIMGGRGVFGAAAPVISGRIHQSGTPVGGDGTMNIEINLDDRQFTTNQTPGSVSSQRRNVNGRAMLTQATRIVNQLDEIYRDYSQENPAENTETAADTTEASSAPSESETNNAATEGETAEGSTGARVDRNTTRQPMMSEVHDLYVRFTRVQAQLQPLIDSYSTFLAQDPAFTSTNSAEYQSAARIFALVPNVLRNYSDFYDFLANASVPLERVPPRPVTMTNSSGRQSNVIFAQRARSNRHGNVTGRAVSILRGPPPPSGVAGSATPTDRHQPRTRRVCVGHRSTNNASSDGQSSRSRSTSSVTRSTTTRSSAPPAPPSEQQVNPATHPRIIITINPSFEIANQQPSQNFSTTTTTETNTSVQPDQARNAAVTGDVRRSGIIIPNISVSAGNQSTSDYMNEIGENVSRAISDTVLSTINSYLNPGQGGNNILSATTPTNTSTQIHQQSETTSTVSPSLQTAGAPTSGSTNIFATIMSDMNLAAEYLFQNLGRSLRSYLAENGLTLPENLDAGKDLFEKILIEFINHFTFQDLINAFHGNGKINMKRLVSPLKKLFLSLLFDGNYPESYDDIKKAVDQIESSIKVWLKIFFNVTLEKSDLIERNCQAVIVSMHRLLSGLFLSSEPDIDFLGGVVFNFIKSFCSISGNILVGEKLDFFILQYFRERFPQYREDADIFIKLIKPLLNPERASPYLKDDLNFKTSSSCSVEDVVKDETEMEVQDETEIEVQDETEIEGQDAREDEEMETSINVSSDSSASKEKEDRGDDEWKRELPEGWVPIIEADLVLQTSTKQVGMSPAYLAGKPASKRRK